MNEVKNVVKEIQQKTYGDSNKRAWDLQDPEV